MKTLEMKRKSLIVLTMLLTVLTTTFGLIYLSRLKIAYNSEGAYFDESEGLVYHEQSVPFWGALTFVLFILTLLTAWQLRKILLKR